MLTYCKVCFGTGTTEWGGDDCPECLDGKVLSEDGKTFAYLADFYLRRSESV